MHLYTGRETLYETAFALFLSVSFLTVLLSRTFTAMNFGPSMNNAVYPERHTAYFLMDGGLYGYTFPFSTNPIQVIILSFQTTS